MDYKLIIFDLSNVCFNSEEPPFIAEFCHTYGLDENKFDTEYQELINRAEIDEMSGVNIWKIMLKKYNIIANPEDLIEKMMSMKSAYEDTLCIAKKLKEKGYVVVYLSNYSRDYWNYVSNRWNMSEYFTDGIISYQIKARKPAPAGFNTLMKRFGVSPSETLFIDDSLKNLEAAKSLGINAYQFKSANELETFLKEKRVL